MSLLEPRKLALDKARETMQISGCWSDNQQMGRRWPIGCIALEITQRCNLDCSICYLSEYSEATKDIPLEIIFRRIDQIHSTYGPDTDIQITGGEPTLRNKQELITIVKYINKKKMRATLMTNGLRAKRVLLEELARVGLNDVVFHVDTTQNLKQGKTETELIKTREEYINNARGLGLSIMFNTTIHQNNFLEIPALIKFFSSHAESIRTVSFQLQADTGRGTNRSRHHIINLDTVWHQIESALEMPLNFNAIQTGHKDCNRYAMCLISSTSIIDLFQDTKSVSRLQAATSHIRLDRNKQFHTIIRLLFWLISHPLYYPTAIKWAINLLRQFRVTPIKLTSYPNTLSIFTHNFMDACHLDANRINACVFKVMTDTGPVSMCQYNANRDQYILNSLSLNLMSKAIFWQPFTGKLSQTFPADSVPDLAYFPLKKLKGRSRQQKTDKIRNAS